MVSQLWNSADSGLSLVLDHRDPILDPTLDTKSDGNLAFKGLFLRISERRNPWMLFFAT